MYLPGDSVTINLFNKKIKVSKELAIANLSTRSIILLNFLLSFTYKRVK